MSRSFDGATQYGKYAGALVADAPLTIAAWCQINGRVSGTYYMIANVCKAASNSWLSLHAFGTSTGNVTIYADDYNGTTDGAAASSVTISDSKWHHCCAVFSATNARAIYIDGTSRGTNTTSVTQSGLDTTMAGAIYVSGGVVRWLNGLLGEVAMWNGALTATEVAQLAAGVSPLRIQPLALLGYWPFQAYTSPELDLHCGTGFGAQHALTLTGTPPVGASHPPVEPYSRRFWGSYPQFDTSAVVIQTLEDMSSYIVVQRPVRPVAYF